MTHEPYIREIPGSREAALLVHGIVGTPRHFDPILPAIPAGVSVYNILLDGHGGSVRDFAGSSMEKWRAQVDDTLGALCEKYERVYIIAHSMGTLLTISAALERQERIRGMVLLASPMKVWVRPIAVAYALQAAFGVLRPGSGAERLANDTGARLTPRLWEYLTWVPRFLELFAEIGRCRGLVDKIRVPCTALQSARDELVSRKAAKYLALNPAIEIITLPGSGHFAYSPEDLETIRGKVKEMWK